MYLPVILLRRFGWLGFLAFAVPNVLGCAAFGYVLRPRTSQRIVQRHQSAMRWFSIVTIAYHMFFIPFFAATFILPVPDIGGPTLEHWFGLILAIAVLAAAVIVSLLPARLWPMLAILTYAFSLAAFVQWGAGPLSDITWVGQSDPGKLAWMTPTIVFGFLFCPYLDSTFHRALRESPSRHSFAIFGLSFGVLMLFTCAYAFASALTALVMGYVLGQSTFTIAAHLRELRQAPGSQQRFRHLAVMFALIALAVLSFASTAGGDGRLAGEGIYLRFLAFYSLIFPAYVLLFLGPGRPMQLSRRNVMAYGAAVLLALPLYELGFIHGRSWLLILPLAGLLVWRWMGRKRRNSETFNAVENVRSAKGQ